MIYKFSKQKENMKFIAARAAFSLAEVVVASAVIAMMMVSLIGYVQSAGELWQKSHATITISNEGNSMLDFIERELWGAKEVSVPAIGDTTSTLVYTKVISDYDVTPEYIPLDFQVVFDSATHVASTNLVESGALWTAAGVAGWAIDTVQGDKKILRSRYNYDISKSLISFSVNRTANRLLNVTIMLSIKRPDEEFPREIEFKRSIIVR